VTGKGVAAPNRPSPGCFARERAGVGPWWLVPPDGPGLLCPPDRLAALVALGREDTRKGASLRLMRDGAHVMVWVELAATEGAGT
jgi:hypothetical protein